MAEPLAEKVVQPAVNPKHLAYCPTMDLIALATINDQVHVFRLNGQEVFGVANKRVRGEVKHLKWKPNGQSLAVAFSNQTLCLTNSHTGKMVHLIDCSKHSESPICCLGWGVTFTNSPSLNVQLEKLRGQLTLDEMISQTPQAKAMEKPRDLPLDLAFLDIEGTLPKLSPLASGSIDDDMFSTKASLDTLFHPPNTTSADSADVLLVGFEDGTIHLSIYDFFEIGGFNLQRATEGLEKCRPLLHCYHPLSSTHCLLMSSERANAEELHIVPLDLRLLSNAGRYLSSLASKSNQLYHILRYIRQVQRQMYIDFKTSQDLPSRFIGNIQETLQEQYDLTWAQASYHLVVTGHCNPEIKDWLIDQLSERGHKRWEKATVTGYENVRRLAHEHLLPALERFTVLASRLRGLSKFQLSNIALGLSTQEIDNILDTISCLQLLAHEILLVSGQELRQFMAFSAWLRQEIDIQASDASTESLERDPSVDHATTLEYIQGAMMQSRLIEFFDLQAQTGREPQWDLSSQGGSLFELYKKQLRIKAVDAQTARRLPPLDALITHLDIQYSTVLTRISDTQRRNVRCGPQISLGDGVPSCMDTRMLAEVPGESHSFVLYTALGPRLENSHVHIYRIAIKIENGMSSTASVERASIPLNDWDLKDIKFVDDEELMLAVTNDENSRLLRICYRKKTESQDGLNYGVVGKADGRMASEGVVGRTNPLLERMEEHPWYEFPAGVSWAPERMEVNGRKGRRAVCVLAQDHFHYRIYDLDDHVEAEWTPDAESDGTDELMA